MKKTFALIACLATLSGTAALAQDYTAHLEARQGQMRILALNLGILGGIAKGEIAYDATVAQAAADSIVGVSMVHQATLFPEGSDNMSIDNSRAQPVIWDKMDDFSAAWSALGAAAKEMQAAASGGQEAIGPMLGKIGGTCKACHDTFRAPE